MAKRDSIIGVGGERGDDDRAPSSNGNAHSGRGTAGPDAPSGREFWNAVNRTDNGQSTDDASDDGGNDDALGFGAILTQPLTRDLKETIRALEIVEAEFGFQANRLSRRSNVNGSDNENDHLANLRQGYDLCARYTRILRNYHEGRFRQPRRVDPTAGAEPTIDAMGRAMAYTEDGE